MRSPHRLFRFQPMHAYEKPLLVSMIVCACAIFAIAGVFGVKMLSAPLPEGILFASR